MNQSNGFFLINLVNWHQLEAFHFAVGVARYKIGRQFQIIHELSVGEQAALAFKIESVPKS